MDAILSSISIAALRLVEDVLSNDESSSDDELLDYFIANGLTEPQARQALTYRSQYLCNLFLSGHTPILKGAQALRYNPHRGLFEQM
ncbi:MAG: hypothetical protein AB7Q01_07900 [Gammaproteobacteria bacterium]